MIANDFNINDPCLQYGSTLHYFHEYLIQLNLEIQEIIASYVTIE